MECWQGMNLWVGCDVTWLGTRAPPSLPLPLDTSPPSSHSQRHRGPHDQALRESWHEPSPAPQVSPKRENLGIRPGGLGSLRIAWFQILVSGLDGWAVFLGKTDTNITSQTKLVCSCWGWRRWSPPRRGCPSPPCLLSPSSHPAMPQRTFWTAPVLTKAQFIEGKLLTFDYLPAYNRRQSRRGRNTSRGSWAAFSSAPSAPPRSLHPSLPEIHNSTRAFEDISIRNNTISMDNVNKNHSHSTSPPSPPPLDAWVTWVLNCFRVFQGVSKCHSHCLIFNQV